MNKLILFAGIGIFIGIFSLSLYRELERNEQEIQSGISGVVHVQSGLGHSLVKTDNAYIYLFEPESFRLVAGTIINPFVPPMTFQIGQQNAIDGQKLQGAYHILIVIDKDSQPSIPSPGELRGILTPPVPLGTEEYPYFLDQPFQQMPMELLHKTPSSEKRS